VTAYSELAREFILISHQMRRFGPQKMIEEAMRGESFVIMLLSKKEARALPSEISGIMGISSARVAAVLNGLEHKGLITREIDRDDRRRILVELTPAGKEQAEQYDRMALEGATHMLEILGEEDAKELLRILKKLAVAARRCPNAED